MKKVKKSFVILLAVALFCSAMCIGALADGATPYGFTTASTSTYVSFVGSKTGDQYVAVYADSAYTVGYGYANKTSCVKMVQAYCYLDGLFSSTSSIDGLMGQNTNNAICGYQGRYLGASSVDGVVGENTWRSMGYYVYGVQAAKYL